MNKEYLLMNKDNRILQFKVSNTLQGRFTVLKQWNSIPYMLRDTNTFIDNWITQRTIPSNRIHIKNILESLELNSNDKFSLLLVNHGCSLNDTFWIKEVDEKNIYGQELSWSDVSLYRGFKEYLGLVSFFGNTSSLGGKLATPEVTTQGMLGKAWRKQPDGIYLYKKGTSGYANAGNEPYSELMASVIAEILDIPHIKYELDKWNDILCSKCKLYTNEKLGYITMSEYMTSKYGRTNLWRYDDVLKETTKFNLQEKFEDMLLFDFIINNEDRHFNNFGFVIDNDTLDIVDFMPLFDHGYSLGNFMLNVTEVDNLNYKLGTFDIPLDIQGKEISKKHIKKAKNWSKRITLNIDKIDTLPIPEERKIIAKKLLRKSTDIINTL